MPCERCRCPRCDGAGEEEEFRRGMARPRRRGRARRAAAPIRRWRPIGMPVAPPSRWRPRVRPAPVWTPTMDEPADGAPPVDEPTAPAMDEPASPPTATDEPADPAAAAPPDGAPDPAGEWGFESAFDESLFEADLEYEQVPLTAADATIPGKTIDLVPANACQVPRTGSTFTTRAAAAITHIVIHMIERSAYASSIENWRKGGGDRCFKPHYAVSKTGQITQIVAEQHLAQHGNLANAYSIGIEHEGFSRNPEDMTEALYLASAALCRNICARYRIPVDAAHIIGHDMAPGNCAPGSSCHGDPGGYWDWEYFLALVKWDGTSAQRRPIRLIVDTASPNFHAGTSWSRINGRSTGAGGPHPSHSWSRQFVSASPAAAAPAGDVARFGAVIPAPGTYTVSLWWPARAGHNSATPVRVDKMGHLRGTLGVRPIVQNTHRVRFRRTVALPATPVWTSLGQLDCVAGNVIWVEVSRRSPKPGRVVADAVRIFRKW
jgi:N-acetyl-anhydromuramyl-L-alanine amidase AmpD